MRMFYNNLKIIFFIFILSQSFLTYGSQQNNIYETSKDISPPKFQDIKNGMKELLDKVDHNDLKNIIGQISDNKVF